MLDLFKKSLIGQYEAALSMLNDCVSKCPDEHWNGKVGSYPFWHAAYHTLYYTDLYLSRDEESFTPASFHRENYQIFGKLPWPPHETVVADIPYDRQTLLDYIRHCGQKASQSVNSETEESLQGPCGFWWYKIPRAEFHVNNVRHVQHHAAQLSLYLRKSAGIEIGWVGSGLAGKTKTP
jgi:hypothetical protein